MTRASIHKHIKVLGLDKYYSTDVHYYVSRTRWRLYIPRD